MGRDVAKSNPFCYQSSLSELVKIHLCIIRKDLDNCFLLDLEESMFHITNRLGDTI